MNTDEGKKTRDVEEEATADPEPDPVPEAGPAAEPDKDPLKKPPKKGARSWTTYPTRHGEGKYKVDATDLTNIFVKVKINLVPRGEGTWDDVKNIKKLEDGIEKHASRKGFTVNVEFVNPENKPDFVKDDETAELGANPKWPTATSWGGDARTNAHELYHVLNFPLDRYNYIESHAQNEDMVIADRLHWFLQQMRKPKGFDNPKSLMGSGQEPLEEDICQIAQLDVATCVKAREKLFPPPIESRFTFPTVGYANLGNTSGAYVGLGYDLGIPLTFESDWRLFVGLHGSMITQLEGDKRLAFLLGARIGIEKSWATSKLTGLNLGGFAEGGGAFVRDQEALGTTSSFVPGAYGYGGMNLGYKFSSIGLSLETELGAGVTSKLGLHDPDTFVEDPKILPFFTAGIRATWMFGGK